MIIVNVSHIHIILFKNDKKIGVISDKVLRDARVRLTDRNSRQVGVVPCKNRSVLFLTCYVIKNNNRAKASLIGGKDLLMVLECEIANTLDGLQQFLQKHVFWLIQRFRIDVDVLKPETVGIGDESHYGIGFPAVGGAANNGADGIGQEIAMPLFFCMLVDQRVKVDHRQVHRLFLHREFLHDWRQTYKRRAFIVAGSVESELCS